MLDDNVKSLWSHAFGLTYSITLAPGELTTSLQVANTGAEALEFQTLFHTYLAINVRSNFLPGSWHFVHSIQRSAANGPQDISSAEITGLESVPFINKVPSPKQSEHSKASIKFESETDRVYTGAEQPVSVVASGKPVYEIRREGLGDMVVWNPWSEKAKGMSDFGPEDGWKKMVCVEAGSVEKFAKIEGGETWEGRQVIRAML